MKCARLVEASRDYSSENKTRVLYSYPCGKCMPCRITKRQSWTLRLLLEARIHKYQYYITLTYNDDNLPDNGSLDKKHAQNFIKRLRKNFNHPIRFFLVAEYGERNTKRPHYHAIIYSNEEIHTEWGYVYNGKTHKTEWRITDSPFHKAWTLRGNSFGRVLVDIIPTSEDGRKVAQYVSGYVVKKLTNPKEMNKNFAEIKKDVCILNVRIPEFTIMSRGNKKGDHGIGLQEESLRGLVRALKKHKIGPTGTDQEIIKPIHMLRLNKKLWPVDRQLRNRLLELLTDKRTDYGKAIQLDIRIKQKIRKTSFIERQKERQEDNDRQKRTETQEYEQRLRSRKI